MAITYVAGQEEVTVPSGSPHTTEVNTGTRTNGLLVSTWYFDCGGTLSSFTVTYAGQAMTEVISWNVAGNLWFKVFCIPNPDDGADDQVITYSNSSATFTLYYNVISWYDGVKQTGPEDQTNTGSGSTDPSLTITPTENDELIVSHYYSGANATLTPTAPHAIIHVHSWGPFSAGGGYTIQTTAQEETVAWTGVDDDWWMVVASFKALAAADAKVPMQNFNRRVYAPRSRL